MGRGKSKAKQTKVARELKYGSGGSDLSALEAELSGNDGNLNLDEGDLKKLESPQSDLTDR